MKKIFFILFTVFSGITSAQNDLNGIWKDSSGTAFTNGTMIITQEADSIVLTHYLEFNGKPFVEVGTGNIVGDSVIYKLNVTLPIEGWSTTGTHYLKLSDDKSKLIGKYIDGKGNTGRIVFIKFAPVKD